ncbi:Non-specific serine/threonine protein kinase [Handroanthus impetiginosus]|uniref:Non-specific serine/threonine protein kinase n=1 Tax=Handroanthus impetiginosus TaxID=429701 RepID=A0A2G9H2P9_9LAMI|nr:Non-specific serine/threonine protein kinase [Handroanthus impetiginosus]
MRQTSFSWTRKSILLLLLLDGDAEISRGKIELNKLNYLYRVGQVIYNGKVPLWDSNSGKLADFTTHFSFTVDTQNRSDYGTGIAVFLAPIGFHIPANSAGTFLGLFNKRIPDVSQTQILSTEFDSFVNDGWDPPHEHVGINKNSIKSSITARWNVTFHSGEPADVWIVYNSITRNLSVFWSYGNGPNSSLSYQIDLKEILPQWVIVGISAATGTYIERHMLESWEFSSSLDIDDSNKKFGTINCGVVGTLGYLAPEYVSTGRASKESDVYSFGVVALEIATGRKSVDKQLEKGLLDWIWDLYGNGQLISAMDERMQTGFEPKQVECLMIVGLWCAHPDRTLRPSIRQASRVLSFEADMPQLPTKMPIAMYYAPR